MQHWRGGFISAAREPPTSTSICQHNGEHVHRTKILGSFYSAAVLPRTAKAITGMGHLSRRGLHRWHIPDPIYSISDLRVTWQQIGN